MNDIVRDGDQTSEGSIPEGYVLGRASGTGLGLPSLIPISQLTPSLNVASIQAQLNVASLQANLNYTDLEANLAIFSTANKGLVSAPSSADVAAGRVLAANNTFISLPTVPTAGLIFLASGSVSAVAALDIILAGYTSYRGIKIVITNLVSVTNSVDLYIRLSTDGGTTFATTGYSYAMLIPYSNATNNIIGAGSSTGSAGQIIVNVASTISNVADRGINVDLDLHQQTNTSLKTKLFIRTAQYDTTSLFGGGIGSAAFFTAQDTDAVRFLLSSGNISSCTYAVYGYV